MALKKHSPEILTGIGIAGMIATTILAVKATPKALILIEEKKDQENAGKLAPIELVKTTWKYYVSASVTCGISIFCLIGASSVNVGRNAVLAAAYTLSESALKEYREKVLETIGAKKERAVRDAIVKDKIDKNPVSSQEIIITPNGNTLCYDVISGRYFKSDIEKLKKVENKLNRRMISEMYVSLNDFYYEIGLRDTKMGDDLGWSVSRGFIDLCFSSQLADDGTPCLVLDYHVAPQYDFQKF
jgi:hypothetical protein